MCSTLDFRHPNEEFLVKEIINPSWKNAPLNGSEWGSNWRIWIILLLLAAGIAFTLSKKPITRAKWPDVTINPLPKNVVVDVEEVSQLLLEPSLANLQKLHVLLEQSVQDDDIDLLSKLLNKLGDRYTGVDRLLESRSDVRSKRSLSVEDFEKHLKLLLKNMYAIRTHLEQLLLKTSSEYEEIAKEKRKLQYSNDSYLMQQINRILKDKTTKIESITILLNKTNAISEEIKKQINKIYDLKNYN